MKRFISIFMILCICSAAVFADMDGDEYNDGYIYEQNGAGDQFLKIDLLGNFPLNFEGQLYMGAGASLGYYRFLSSKLAIGGDAIIAYNISIGNKPLVCVPITFGAIFQPVLGNFEFPLSLGAGISTTACQGMTYFPGFAAKVSAGAYYRFTEAWSFGLYSDLYWMPQWFADSSKNDNGIFAAAGLSARYHF